MIRRFFLLFILPVFLFASNNEVVNNAVKLKLFEKNEWKALLHYSDNNFDIIDANFIVSNKKSLKDELVKTINSFYISPNILKDSNQHFQCKFPARFLFIKHELSLIDGEFPSVKCNDFSIYKQKAPAKDISLIYASENVTKPASMMGHTFLKISGINDANKSVEHAITFYTVIDTPNPLTLIYKNIFPGMQGIFALQPYTQVVNQYIKNENRNVWEYQLDLEEYEKKLIYYHIWELRNIKMNYYFTSYNCSTVIYYLLSLANPDIYNDKKLWITPLTTVQFLYKYNLIKKSLLIPSDEWFIKMLEENLTFMQLYNIIDIVHKKQLNKIKLLNFDELELLNVYMEVEYKKGTLDHDQYIELKKRVRRYLFNNKSLFDLAKYKSPKRIPSERIVGLGYSHLDNQNYMEVSFLGASHLIDGNNREYFGESELRIGYISMLLNQDNIDLREFTLYSMKSYMPYDILTKDLSYQFDLSVKKDYTTNMKYKNTFKLDAGIGIDFLLAKDINFFLIFNGGLGYNYLDRTHLFLNPEIGLMVYEIFNMKSLLIYQPLVINQEHIYNKFIFKHNIFINKDFTFSFNIEDIKSQDNNINYKFFFQKMF